MKISKHFLSFVLVILLLVNWFAPIGSAHAAPLLEENKLLVTENCRELSTHILSNESCSNLGASPVSVSKTRLVFFDSDDFYRNLLNSLKSGQIVDILTEYSSYTDLPSSLRDVFPSPPQASNSIDTTQLVRRVVSTTAVGAAVGGTVGAISTLMFRDSRLTYAARIGIGVFVGSGFGLATSTAVSLVESHNYSVKFLKSSSSYLEIHIEPREVTS